MDASARAPGYDLFKLIVAIILLILSLILMWMSPAGSPAPSPTLSPNPTTVSGSPTSPKLTVTPSPASSPTATNIAMPTATQLASPTDTPVVEPTATPLPTATKTPSAEPTSTPIAGTPVTTACDAAASRARLDVGMQARILRRLNFRSTPGIRQNWLHTNIPGTQVDVVGGPECVPYWTGAYLWWQIKLPDGRLGWSAEGSLRGSYYFMEPTQ